MVDAPITLVMKMVIPDIRRESFFFNGKQVTVLSASTLLADVSLKESGGIFFRSASRFILLGRTHTGDENGKTTYYQGYIRIDK